MHESHRRAREIPETSLTHYFTVLRDMHNASKGPEPTEVTPRRREMASRLENMTYKEALETFAVYGDPAYCIERIQALKEQFGLSQCIGWFNTGGHMSSQQVLESMTLFANKVIPALR